MALKTLFKSVICIVVSSTSLLTNYDHIQVTNMALVVEVLCELENVHMSREELEVTYQPVNLTSSLILSSCVNVASLT